MIEHKSIPSHKINKEENDKIVQLIKSKITPLHQKVHITTNISTESSLKYNKHLIPAK